MQYGGNFLAVGGFSFFGDNDFDGGGNTKNLTLNRHITGTAHQGGNFTAGKLPRTTLEISRWSIEGRSYRRTFRLIFHFFFYSRILFFLPFFFLGKKNEEHLEKRCQVQKKHAPRTCLMMYHTARKVELQPFNRSYSQLTFFDFFFKSELFDKHGPLEPLFLSWQKKERVTGSLYAAVVFTASLNYYLGCSMEIGEYFMVQLLVWSTTHR